MYFPYLRARQFELITLRELTSENALIDKIIPVIEPVKESFNNLNLAHKVFSEHDTEIYLIVNPFVGEKSGDTNYYLDYLDRIQNSRYLPAFHFKDNYNYITSKIVEKNLSNCMLICLDNFSNEDDLKELCKHDEISHIMLLEPHKNRSLDRFIKSLSKHYIRLDDPFEKQQRNADFLNITAHKFTEEHLFYKTDGYYGFGDFSLLPREFSDGGSTPRAVVIHLSYINKENEDQIWIRHFTSESGKDSITNVQGKFSESADKALQFCNYLPLENTAIDELRSYFNSHKYPGLGTVKKISLKNHILVIRSFLD